MLLREKSRLFHIWLVSLIIAALAAFVFLSAFTGITASAIDQENQPSLEAISALLIDARRGQVLYAKSADEHVKTPLTNRLLTALIALEKSSADAMVTASNEAISVEGASLALTVGEKYSVRNMIYAMLLTGANDAAIAIAEHVEGGEAGFVQLMNEYAAKIGMTDTRFTNVTGLYDENQYTTARDIALLVRTALANTEFNKVFSTQAKPWYDENRTLLLTNTNSMFWTYEGTDGGILGYFDPAVQSIVTSATRNSMRLVCILVDVPAEKVYTESAQLFNYGFDNYRYGTLVAAGSVQKTVTVGDETVNLVPTADVHYIYPRGQNYIRNVTINVDEAKLKPPITKNSIVGIMTFTLMDDTVINVELYPDKEILPKKTEAQILKERIKENMELIYVVIGLVILEIILLISKLVNLIRKKRIKGKARRIRR
ncbi:MAG TPA: D-alanyl-D-alanine carboxypeptidase family protein [Thermoclostridium caenicola]|uniref:D-alanyl-D-alanine carboxypeptidase family protein n=1 Tax=Thermoclostridium caenicola TaxID=659425 RepID=UPI002D0E4BAE|nr:D-alanyl-D-alanine carboxypeptidase family protein [Thermoclostridium caenicola]HOK42844.1 D-alanyl-D-alanine carboxypeptidase family protein [Thermoclostridium caenicola]HOL84994.1 D-alanyl-D-alanine carboxypeptidase family protein [Thermoclostridium caenicola]HPO76711.1 D-alanyl-D-alanine carboxypeptidase family protein [Thermoclostridium caenicola]